MKVLTLQSQSVFSFYLSLSVGIDEHYSVHDLDNFTCKRTNSCANHFLNEESALNLEYLNYLYCEWIVFKKTGLPHLLLAGLVWFHVLPTRR